MSSLGVILFDETNNFIGKVIGNNTSGQLGIGINTDESLDLSTNLPRSLKNEPFIKYLSFSENNGGFVTKDGKVYLMGSNTSKQLGKMINVGVTKSFYSVDPVLVEDISNANEVYFGFGNSTFIRTSDGKIWVFGEYSGKYEPGLLREIFTGTHFDSQLSLFDQYYLTNITHFAVGSNFCVMYDETFGLKTMGGADAVQSLGQGPFVTSSITPNSIYLYDNTVSKIACGANHTLILHDNGTVSVFGQNYSGQLGIGNQVGLENYDTVYDPVQNLSLSGVVDIACGKDFSVVVLSNGEAWAFGRGNDGKLGSLLDGPVTSNTPRTTIPIKIADISNAYAVTCGDNFTAILCSDGTVKTFGDNTYGVLGNGTNSYISLLNTVIYEPGEELTGVMALSNSSRRLPFSSNIEIQIENREVYTSDDLIDISWKNLSNFKFKNYTLLDNLSIFNTTLDKNINTFKLPNLPENLYKIGIVQNYSFTKSQKIESDAFYVYNSIFLFIHRHFINLDNLLETISPFTTYTLIDEWISYSEMENAFKINVFDKPYKHVGILFENYNNTIPIYNNITIPLLPQYDNRTTIPGNPTIFTSTFRDIENFYRDLKKIQDLSNKKFSINILSGNLGNLLNADNLQLSSLMLEKSIAIWNIERRIFGNTDENKIYWSPDIFSVSDISFQSLIPKELSETSDEHIFNFEYISRSFFNGTLNVFPFTPANRGVKDTQHTLKITMYDKTQKTLFTVIDLLKTIYNHLIDVHGERRAGEISIDEAIGLYKFDGRFSVRFYSRFLKQLNTFYPNVDFFRTFYDVKYNSINFFKDKSLLPKNFTFGVNNLEPFLSITNSDKSIFCNGNVITGNIIDTSFNFNEFINTILTKQGIRNDARFKQLEIIKPVMVNIKNGIHKTDIKHSMITLRGKLGSSTNILQVSCTPFTTTMIMGDNSVKEFGFLNGFFVNGNDNENVISESSPRILNSKIVQVSSNSFFINSLDETPKLVSTRLYLTSEGTVIGSGYSGFYQLSDTIVTNGNTYYDVYPIVLQAKISQVSCGVTHCAFLEEGGNRIYFSGNNEYGQIGWGYNRRPHTSPPELTRKHSIYMFEDISNVLQVECGNNCTYILTFSGEVYQLGEGFIVPDTIHNSYEPYKLVFPEIDNETPFITKISCSKSHVLFLTRDGNVLGAGMNGRTSNFKPIKIDSSATNITSPEFLFNPKNELVTNIIDICALQNRSYLLLRGGDVILYNTFTIVGNDISHLSSTTHYINEDKLKTNYSLTHNILHGEKKIKLNWDFGAYKFKLPQYYIIKGIGSDSIIHTRVENTFTFDAEINKTYNIQILAVYPGKVITLPTYTISYLTITNELLLNNLDIELVDSSNNPLIDIDKYNNFVTLKWNIKKLTNTYIFDEIKPDSYQIIVKQYDANSNIKETIYTATNNDSSITLKDLEFDKKYKYIFEIKPVYKINVFPKRFIYNQNNFINLEPLDTSLQDFILNFSNLVPVYYVENIVKFRR